MFGVNMEFVNRTQLSYMSVSATKLVALEKQSIIEY